MLKIATLLGLFIIVLVYFGVTKKVIYNATPSYPTGLYLVTSKNEYGKGDLVAVCTDGNNVFEAKNKGYIQRSTFYCANGFAPLIKKIAGVAGDKVDVTPRGVWINGDKQKNDLILPQVKPCLGRHKIGKGQIWIMSDFHPEVLIVVIFVK